MNFPEGASDAVQSFKSDSDAVDWMAETLRLREVLADTCDDLCATNEADAALEENNSLRKEIVRHFGSRYYF